MLWSVLLLEIMSPQAGWQLIWNDEKEDYDVVTRWGKDPSLAEIETQRRYFDIIRSEVEQLRRIFQRGVDDKFLKPVGDMKRMSGNIYFSYTMTILQGFITPTNMDEAIELFLDRFLHGHCNQKGVACGVRMKQQRRLSFGTASFLSFVRQGRDNMIYYRSRM